MPRRKAILALDAGTTSSRALVFGETGAVLAVAQREFRQYFPHPAWVEHDAEEIWRTQIDVAAEALSSLDGVEIAAIGITNQRETTVIWDRGTGRPIAPAIVWQDRRTTGICDELREHEPLVRARTGLLLDAYFSGTKVRWLLDSIDGARSAAEAGRLAFGTIDSWLIWNLTGGRTHATDETNASRTLLFDVHRAEWDDDLLALLRVPRALLPAVFTSSEIVARTADGLPIPSGIPIAGVAGDQQSSLFGQRCTRAGMAKNTYGTGSFVVMHSGGNVAEPASGVLSTIACRRPSEALQYAVEGSIFVTGAAIQWLRDSLGIIKRAADVEALAASVPDSDGVTFVPAFTGLGTPYWDPHARGAITGLTRGTTAAHLARAALDAIALQTADVLDAMRRGSGIELAELRVDGGASTNDLLMQIQADVAGLPVVRSRVAETTALGAAALAGLATDCWTSEQLDTMWTRERTFMPAIREEERAARLAAWRRAVDRLRSAPTKSALS